MISWATVGVDCTNKSRMKCDKNLIVHESIAEISVIGKNFKVSVKTKTSPSEGKSTNINPRPLNRFKVLFKLRKNYTSLKKRQFALPMVISSWPWSQASLEHSLGYFYTKTIFFSYYGHHLGCTLMGNSILLYIIVLSGPCHNFRGVYTIKKPAAWFYSLLHIIS